MTEGGNGAGAGDPVEVTFEQAMQLEAERQFHMIFAFLKAFAPHLPDAAMVQLAKSTALEQVQAIPEEILPTLLDPSALAKFPTFIANVRKSDGSLVATVQGPKRIDKVSDPGVAGASAMLMALLLCPQARALLKAFGWNYDFAQSAKPAAGAILLT